MPSVSFPTEATLRLLKVAGSRTALRRSTALVLVAAVAVPLVSAPASAGQQDRA